MKQLIRFCLSIITLTLLTACDAIPTLNNSSDSGDTGSVVISIGLSPQETIETFLNAWSSEDFDTMYGLLHPRSDEVYSIDAFRELYISTHADIGFAGINYTIHDVELQGTSSAIDYDVTLSTETFGEIVDMGRTMRLVENNGSWTIAWSPMDIINGMTANVRLDPTRQFPQRGNIYDTNGQFLVNENGTSYALRLVLSDMFNEEDCTALLSRILLRPVSYFNALYVGYRAADSAFFVGEIDSETYNIYRDELDRLCGTNIDIAVIGTKTLPRVGRTYFGQGAAAHITGYFGFIPSTGALNVDYWRARGYNERDFVGLSGVEFTFETELAGLPDQSLRLIDSSGVQLRELGSASGTDSASVTLTIDRDLQWDVAQTFMDAWTYAGDNWATKATGGAAVVMDINTGAIRSMFSFPTYDPAIFYPDSSYYATSTTNAAFSAQITNAISNGRFLPVGPATTNRAYNQQYAPGSVFKIMSSLAAADSGVWTADREFNCELTWDGSQYGDTGGIREDWRVVEDRDAAGIITMSTALTTSCNPFYWEVGSLMFGQRSDLLANYLTDWGFGAPTQVIGLENPVADPEAAGIIPPPGNDVTIAINNVIGQGDTQVTAVQMARLVSAVANGGTLYQPYIVEQVGDSDSETFQTFEPVVIGQLNVTDEALQETRAGMCQVPINTEFGTSVHIFADSDTPPTYSSCGKTGTAQTNDAPNSWYVAFAPAENPQIAIAVVVPNSREGSDVAAPITRRILDLYFGAPIADFPDWWNELPYIPVEAPRGVGG